MTLFIQKSTSLFINKLSKKLFKSTNSKIMPNLVQNRVNDKKCLISSTTANGVHIIPPQNNGVINKVESQELMTLWPEVVRDLTGLGLHSEKTEVMKWFEKVLQYNVPKGKLIRANIAISSYRKIVPADQLTDENIRLVGILGWCIEIFIAFLMIVDDIMDHSITRRGQPCWYIRNNLGLAGINDGLFLHEAIFQLLMKHFRETPSYLDIVDTFHEIIYKSVKGEALDLMSINVEKAHNLNIFTMDRYKEIVQNKTAYNSFVLPVILAMHYAGIKDAEKFKQAEFILLEIGNFFQVQDDYLDCYGDPKDVGKTGNDIQEGKCSWFLVVALQRVTPVQRQILEECYGRNDPKKVARVRQLYADLKLQKLYFEYEKETFNVIKSQIEQISCGLPHSLFFDIMERIFYRKK